MSHEQPQAAAEWIAPDTLVPWAKNPRDNEHAVQAIADSISRFGFAAPIVARRADLRVIAGHTRLKAAQRLNLDLVPVRLLDVTEQEADALALADNRLGELAEWDDAALGEALAELRAQGADLDGLGWAEHELDELISELDPDTDDHEPEPEPEPDTEGIDTLPEAPEPVCQPGESYTVGEHTLHVGDCLAVLRTLPDNSVDALVTDPPYGLSAPPDIAVVLSHWLAGERYEHNAPGFMGAAWDSFVPGPEVWREVYRVMKPGASGLVFAGTRTVDLMGMALRLAGFEIRDNVAWIYGSGFPKSTDVSKELDRAAGAGREVIGIHQRFGREGRQNYGVLDGHVYGAPSSQEGGVIVTAPATPEAQRFSGYGTALKPAHEPAVLIRKPLEGTIAQNVTKWGTGGLNVDGTRIRTSEQFGGGPKGSSGFASGYQNQGWVPGSDLGRWPANVVLQHLDACTLQGTRKVKGHTGYPDGPGGASMHYASDARSADVRPDAWAGHADEDGMETVEVWDCAPGCPVAKLDEQAGAEDSGPARFFYCAKASRREREAGLDDLPGVSGAEAVKRKEGSAGLNNPRAGAGRTAREVKNIHPTVKPYKLMQWCATLVTPPTRPGEAPPVVLDPFCGSGTTLLAAQGVGVRGIGIELEPKHGDIVLARLRHMVNGEG
jgi:site-specific DNA-methyltransferase (adenine-specific)